MISKTINWILLIFIIISSFYAVFASGYNNGASSVAVKPVPTHVEFSDYKSDYYIELPVSYRTERLLDGTEEFYYIYLETNNGRMTIEYQDTYIDGFYRSAESWKDSFRMCFMTDEEKELFLEELK